MTAFVAVAIPLRYRSRVLPSTTVAGVDVSGLEPAHASDELQPHLAAWQSQTMTLRLGVQIWTPSLSDLGFTVSVDATIATALQHGRGNGLVNHYTHALALGNKPTTLPVVFERNDLQFESFLAGIASELGRPPQEARLEIEGADVVLREGVGGLRLDTNDARTAISDAVFRNTFGEIALKADQVEPQLTTTALEPAWEHATMLSGRSIRLVGDDQVWELDTDDLVGALVLPGNTGAEFPYLDPVKLELTLAVIAENVGVPAQNGLLQPDGNGVAMWEDGVAGRAMDIPSVAQAIVDAATSPERSDRSVTLTYIDLPPEVRAETLNNLGLTKLLARGGSSFEGSPEARRENVHVAAGHVSRTLIPPRSDWSFNESLGAITSENGFVEGHSIQGNWFVDDIGGGVCQISTTVFRAALFAGFRFPEWHYHAFRIPFYELDGSPPGIDAAIFQPNTPDDQELDLVIRNPSDSWAFIQTLVDGDHVTAELYGTPLDYETVVDPPKIGDPIAPPRTGGKSRSHNGQGRTRNVRTCATRV